MKRLVALTAAFAAFAAAAAQEKLAEIEVADTSALIRQAAKLGDHCGMPVIGMAAAEGIRDNILSNKFGPMREGETLTAVVYGDAALLSPSNIEAFAETLDLSAVYPCDMTKETFLKEHPNATETNGVVVLCAEADGKVNIVAKASKEAVAKGVHAGNLIKEVAAVVGGGGGGRPNMAQAGGKDAGRIPEALEKAIEVMKAQLG